MMPWILSKIISSGVRTEAEFVTAGNSSCGKVMFSQACAKNSVHGEGVSVPACTTGHMTREGVPVQGGLCPGGLCPGGLCPSGSLSRSVFFHRGPLSGGGVSVQGEGLCLRGSLLERPPTSCTVKSRRYASYWNAFLF